MVSFLSRKKKADVEESTSLYMGDAWRFTLKGSPRHYDDVKQIIQSDSRARVYFGEALAYERGAGVALWRGRGPAPSTGCPSSTRGGPRWSGSSR